MVWLTSVGLQLEIQLPTPVILDLSSLEVQFSIAKIVGHGITVLQPVDVSCQYIYFLVQLFHLFVTVLCPDLDNPINGTVSQSGNSEGDTATYTCDSGYELVGHQVLNCQANGTWDTSPPICRCQFSNKILN